MLINSVTSAAATGLLGSVTTATGEGASGLAGSGFGPAYLLGGSATSFNQDLYNPQGILLGANRGQLSAASAASSDREAAQRRSQLERVADVMDAGDLEGGREEANRLLAETPGDVTVIRLVAHSYMTEQDYKNAEKSYSRALSFSPDNALVQSELDNSRVLQKSDDEVLSRARHMLKSPTHREAGLQLLSHLSGRSPGRADVYVAMADGFTASKQPLSALLSLGTAVALADPSQLDELIARAEKMAEDFPDVGMPHNILGRAYQRAERQSSAVRELETASRIAPNNVGYLRDLANAYLSRADASLDGGNADAARADIGAAQSIDPANSNLAGAQGRLGVLRAGRDVAAGRFTRALNELGLARISTSSDESVQKSASALYMVIGAHYKSAGADTTALTAYKQAFELDPDSQAARRNTAQLAHQKGLASLAAKDYDIAVDNLTLAHETYSYNETYRKDLADGYDQRGQLKMAMGQIDDAVEDLLAGYRLDSSNTSLATNLADALAQQG